MNPKAPTVLFIDDDIEILDMLKAMFERSSEITVQTAESAKEALEILTQKTFSVIIVDYDMPEISGIELLKILRRQGNTTPIILFTGLGGENTAIEALNNGANFLLKKGDDPQYQFRNLAELVRKIAKQGGVRRTPGSTPPMIIDMINFSSEACFGLDERGNLVAWNESMEHLTGVPATSMIGKGDQIYSEPFFGTRKKMLPNLVFETDEEIKRQKYNLISRVQNGPVIAVTRGKKNDGSDWTIWMKAMPVFDDGGNFVASVATVRDVTATFGDVITDDSAAGTAEEIPELPSPEPKKPAPGIFNKILGKP